VSLADLAAARRTHKTFGPEPLGRETLLELRGLSVAYGDTTLCEKNMSSFFYTFFIIVLVM